MEHDSAEEFKTWLKINYPNVKGSDRLRAAVAATDLEKTTRQIQRYCKGESRISKETRLAMSAISNNLSPWDPFNQGQPKGYKRDAIVNISNELIEMSIPNFDHYNRIPLVAVEDGDDVKLTTKIAEGWNVLFTAKVVSKDSSHVVIKIKSARWLEGAKLDNEKKYIDKKYRVLPSVLSVGRKSNGTPYL